MNLRISDAHTPTAFTVATYGVYENRGPVKQTKMPVISEMFPKRLFEGKPK